MKLKFVDKKKPKQIFNFKEPIDIPIPKYKPRQGGRKDIVPIPNYRPKSDSDIKFAGNRSPMNDKRESFPIYKSETGNVFKDIKKALYTSEDVRAIGSGGKMSEAEEKKFKENVAGAAALKEREKNMPSAVKKYKEKKETAAILAEAEESFKGTRFEKKKK